jgi:omptin
MTSADGSVVFRGSYGIAAIEANELVYENNKKVSQLIWQSTAVSVFTGDLTVDLDQVFLRASASIGIGGDGFMRDYDWLVDGKPWSHRSTHPDTRLNHYFVGSIEAGRPVATFDATTVSITGGIKYTDVKWTGWGGSYVYSDTGFREDRGHFDKDSKGISYRQQWPVPFLGLDLAHREGPWTLGGALQGGVAVNGQGTDDHWMRDLRFIDHVDATPAMMVSTSAEYEFRPNTAVFLSAGFDRMFRGKADTTMIDKTGGGKQKFRNGAGADYMSGTLSIGLRGTF